MSAKPRRCQLAHQRLVELLVYEPESGIFLWRKTLGSRAINGSIAGSKTASGYVCIRLDGVLYMAHRLAWLYINCAWPVNDVDHINGIKSDNRISNLRDITNHENRLNTSRARSDSLLGIQGVMVDSRNGRAASSIRLNGTSMFLGSFETAEQASEAYRKAKSQLHTSWSEAAFIHDADANHLLNLSGDRRVRFDSKTGVRGVSRLKTGKYRARIRGRHIGVFDEINDAKAAFDKADNALKMQSMH